MKRLWLACFSLMLVFMGWQLAFEPGQAMANEMKKKQTTPSVTITLKNSKGEEAGTAVLTQGQNGVVVRLKAHGLKPGFHGIHFHQKGVCNAPDFKSAGDHINPYGKQHGLKNPKGPHAGDLMNVMAGSDGKVDTTFVTPRVSLKYGVETSLRDEDGSALVIHADPDDQMTNPSGNSGARIACGVIR